jgi:hypothetical protein
VGARPKTVHDADYLEAVHHAFADLRKNRPPGLEGLLFVVLENCLIYWAHWTSGDEYHDDFLAGLKAGLCIIMDKFAEPKEVPPSMSQEFEGFPDIRDGDSYAIQFERRKKK